MKKAQCTVYSKGSGVEIAPTEKRSEGRQPEGRVALRFFKLEEGATSIRFMVEPWECFDLSQKIDRVVREGGKEKLTHRFEGSQGEVITMLTVEKWERNGKSGCALAVQRDKESINVPAEEARMLHAAEFLRYLSTSQAWVEAVEKPAPSL
ncbi:MAG TPA: hypothetical protein VFR01_04260 [Geobacterales bacterium]|nr:hypothetical protein [Geobacterales bacterium]